jgi:hypothetical protein
MPDFGPNLKTAIGFWMEKPDRIFDIISQIRYKKGKKGLTIE